MSDNQLEEVQVPLSDQLQERRTKLEQWRSEGKAYPNGFERKDFAGTLLSLYDSLEHDELEAKAVPVQFAGRMMTRRVMGKASFINLKDMTGVMQVYARANDLPEGLYEDFKHWDIGDIIGVEGVLFKTKTGELSVKAQRLVLLTKALRPLPDKYHGLHDQEVCYRQRYLDLMVNQETRNVFLARSKIIQAIRNYLLERNFLEVETPMMQALPGGAAAKPFETYHNALDMPLFLRIAPELYLKRLVVGGFEQVFEINRNFRNEGISTRHNPEFTMLEFYQAYKTHNDLMDLTESLLQEVSQQVLGTQQVHYQGHDLDFSKPFERLSVVDAILKYNPDLSLSDLTSVESIKKVADKLKITFKPDYGLGKMQIEIFEQTAEHLLMGPVFITQYPAEVSPLARKNDLDPFVTDRFEFFLCGREIANGFSELNDPDDQRERFHQQVEAAKAGDDEAMPYDEDYITALEYGLPPTAGEGIGIDRLAMIFTNTPSIRDVILFPHMRTVK